jgi:tRNA pseudouridine13 synthase
VSVPEIDQQIGIETYATRAAGIGGAIRRKVEDFMVQEVLVDGSKASVEPIAAVKPPLGATAERQHFLLCILVKRNWDTFIAIKNLAKALGIGQQRIAIAGIKDAKAVTAQHITLEGVNAEQAAAVQLKGIELRPVGYFREPLCAFYLLGNSFTINITQITQPQAAIEEHIKQVATEVAETGGIPNFYGHQRFGTTRAITHQVGKAMVQGSLEEAAMLFLAQPSPYEHPDSHRVRQQLWETRDFQQALQDFPPQLRFERVMLAHLAQNPTDFSGAFRRLPPKLQLLFVQAWQSYLFNRFLSARIKANIPLSRAEVGDFVVNVERSGVPMVQTGKIVDSARVGKINGLIEAGKMRVALPLFGLSSGCLKASWASSNGRFLRRSVWRRRAFKWRLCLKSVRGGSCVRRCAPSKNPRQARFQRIPTEACRFP